MKRPAGGRGVFRLSSFLFISIEREKLPQKCPPDSQPRNMYVCVFVRSFGFWYSSIETIEMSLRSTLFFFFRILKNIWNLGSESCEVPCIFIPTPYTSILFICAFLLFWDHSSFLYTLFIKSDGTCTAHVQHLTQLEYTTHLPDPLQHHLLHWCYYDINTTVRKPIAHDIAQQLMGHAILMKPS